MQRAAANKESSRTTTTYETGESVSVTTSTPIRILLSKPEHQRSTKNIESAVYSYIRAMRALGNTRVNSGDIARALGLSLSKVEKILPKLNEKGVKRVG